MTGVGNPMHAYNFFKKILMPVPSTLLYLVFLQTEHARPPLPDGWVQEVHPGGGAWPTPSLVHWTPVRLLHIVVVLLRLRVDVVATVSLDVRVHNCHHLQIQKISTTLRNSRSLPWGITSCRKMLSLCSWYHLEAYDLSHPLALRTWQWHHYTKCHAPQIVAWISCCYTKGSPTSTGFWKSVQQEFQRNQCKMSSINPIKVSLYPVRGPYMQFLWHNSL